MYGAIRHSGFGKTGKDTQGTAFVVRELPAIRQEDIYEDKKACEALNGFNVGSRYIVALYFNKSREKNGP